MIKIFYDKMKSIRKHETKENYIVMKMEEIED